MIRLEKLFFRFAFRLAFLPSSSAAKAHSDTAAQYCWIQTEARDVLVPKTYAAYFD